MSRARRCGLVVACLLASLDAGAADVTLIVRTRGSGVPVHEAVVRLGEREATTGEDGRVTLDVPVGEQPIAVLSPEHAAYDGVLTISEDSRRPQVVWLDALAEGSVVEVIAPRQPAEARALVRDQETLRTVAGALGDPIRALQTDPSIAPVLPGDPGLVVRGAEPTHTPVRIDGIEVPWLYHWFFLRSVVDPSRLDRIVFRPGGLPASQGRFTQGLVDVSTIDRAEDRGFHGRVSFDLLDVGLSGRVRAGHWHVLASGRVSWGGEVLGIGTLAASGGAAYAPARFSDYSLRVTGDLGDHTVILTAMGAADALRLFLRDDEDQQAAEDTLPFDPSRLLDRQFHRLQLRWLARGPTWRVDSQITGGFDKDNNAFDQAFGAVLDSVPGPTYGFLRSWRGLARTHARVDVAPRWTLDFGADGDLQQAASKSYAVLDDAGDPLVDAQWLGSMGAWVSAEANLSRVWLSVGARGSVHHVDGRWYPAAEPRLAVRGQASDHVTVSAFAGGTSQRPAAWQSSAVLGTDGIGIHQAWQAGAGVELALPRGVSLDVQAYGTWFPRVVVQRDVVTVARRPPDDPRLTLDITPTWLDLSGWAAGGEATLRWVALDGRGDVGLGLTAGRSTRIDRLGAFPADRDQPFRGVLHGTWRPGKRWVLSGRLLVAAGRPATSVTSASAPLEDTSFGVLGVRNDIRGPWWRQLDLRVAKTFQARRARWTLFLEVANATASRIAILERYDPRTDKVEPVVWIPVLPLLGLEVVF